MFRLISMDYWIYVTTSENWAITEKTNVLGASVKYRKTLDKLKKGDKCLVYIKSEKVADEMQGPKIVAQYNVTSSVFEDSNKLFIAPKTAPFETYALRLNLAPIKIFEPPIEFKPLVAKLFFLPNKQNWTGPIRGKAMVKIPKSDYDFIISHA
jgi:predicted RNA-binding protein